MLIVTVRSGQLCNRLFQFAHLIAFCKHHNLKVVNLAFAEYAHYFNSTDERLLVSFPACSRKLRNRLVRTQLQRIFRILGFFVGRLMSKLPNLALVKFDDEETAPESVQKLESLLRNRLIFVEGWYFRDPIDFCRYADDIRGCFIPQEKYVLAAREIHRQIRQDSDIVIGLHIRRKDYKSFEGGKYYFDDQKYAKIIQALLDQFPGKRVGVLVASDERVVLEKFVPVSDRIVCEMREPMIDLMALSLCDYIVGPPSTFSSWASFYGKVPLFIVEDPERLIDLEKACPNYY